MFVSPLSVTVEAWGGPPFVKVRGGSAFVKVPSRLLEDPEGGPLLLWYFRHCLAHLHYCPYNLRTVQVLSRAAYEEARSWAHVHNAVRLFADLQIDLFYLPLKYGRFPLHLADEFYARPRGLEALRYAAYKHVYKEALPLHRVSWDVKFYGALLAEVILSPRPWVSKVKVVASILKRVQQLGQLKKLRERAGEGVPLTEDLEADFLAEARRSMAGLSKEEARELYRHWVRERLDVKAMEKEVKRLLKRAVVSGERGPEERQALAPMRGEVGEEPELPSRVSKPTAKVEGVEELLWRALWYRAKAEEFMISYGGSVRRRGAWAIYAYSDLWTVEDDIEDLDLEATTEEGPLIPEETTLKDVNTPSSSGEVLVQERAPSVLVVLDTSRSMLGASDEAAIAAFSAYLSAKRAGGRVAVINFSTNYVLAGWEEQDMVKEFALSAVQGELTILPLQGIKRALSGLEAGEGAVVMVITDCGWQNLREAVPFLERLSSAGHWVVVLHVEGWKYLKSVEAVSAARGLTLYRVHDPSMLRYLAIAATGAHASPVPS